MRRLGPDPRRVDWFRVLADLRYAGIDVQSVSGMIRVPKSTILGWKQGAEPKFADGERLIEFWMRVLGKPAEAIPRMSGVTG